jgi:hypothetical protein
MAHHNQYLKADFYRAEPSLRPLSGAELDSNLPDDFLPSNFLSSHFFVARVLHPLALDPSKPFSRNSHFVTFLSEALGKPVGDYSPIKAQAFKKSSVVENQ